MGDSDVDQVFKEHDEDERRLKQELQRRARMERVRLQNRMKVRRAKRKPGTLSTYQKARETYITRQEDHEDRDSSQDSDSEDPDSDPDPNLPSNPTRYITKNITPSREMIRKMIQEEYPEERDRVLQFRIQHLESEIQNLRRGYKIQIQKLHAQLQEFIQKYQLKYTVCKA